VNIARNAWYRIHHFAEPQSAADFVPDSIEGRERLRRGRLLATFLMISLLFGITLLLASVYTHPAKSYMTGLVTGVRHPDVQRAAESTSKVELASVIYLSATIISCVMNPLHLSEELLPACVLLYGFYLSAVSRRAS